MANPEETRDYYDTHADVYDRKTGFDLDGGQAYNFHKYYEPYLRREMPANGRVLELGCGTGFYTRWFQQRGVEVSAMDISPQMVELARARCREGVSFFVGNCEDPAAVMDPDDVRDGFDAIVGINTFSYYAHKQEALRNYRGLLRSQGRLIMLDMNGTSLTQQIAYLLNYREARKFSENIDQSVPERLRALLEAAGFAVETMERFTFMPNEAGRLLVSLWAPVDEILSRLSLADRFAFRIFWVARKV